jgi:hypothetical protein
MILVVMYFPVINGVQQRRHWLSDEAKGYPKDNIAD